MEVYITLAFFTRRNKKNFRLVRHLPHLARASGWQKLDIRQGRSQGMMRARDMAGHTLVSGKLPNSRKNTGTWR
jgi:hypothetical protein